MLYDGFSLHFIIETVKNCTNLFAQDIMWLIGGYILFNHRCHRFYDKIKSDRESGKRSYKAEARSAAYIRRSSEGELKGVTGLSECRRAARRVLGLTRDLLVTSPNSAFLFSVYLTDQGLPFIGNSENWYSTRHKLDATLLAGADLYRICL